MIILFPLLYYYDLQKYYAIVLRKVALLLEKPSHITEKRVNYYL